MKTEMLSKLASTLLFGAALSFASASAFAQSTVKIGSVLSVTGPAAFLGEDMKAGMELAVEEINAKGGVAGRRSTGCSTTQRARPRRG